MVVTASEFATAEYSRLSSASIAWCLLPEICTVINHNSAHRAFMNYVQRTERRIVNVRPESRAVDAHLV